MFITLAICPLNDVKFEQPKLCSCRAMSLEEPVSGLEFPSQRRRTGVLKMRVGEGVEWKELNIFGVFP